MAKINFGGVDEEVVTRKEFSMTKARKALKGQTIAVVGYGVQGPAQALNMRDNGFKVIVGQRQSDRPGSSWQRALKDGWVPGKTLFSYEEAAEMAAMGARVLHPLTIEPARKKNIPIKVLNSRNHACAGTVVGRDEDTPSGPKSIAVKDDILFITVKSSKLLGVTRMLGKVFSSLDSARIPVILATASDSEVYLTIPAERKGEGKVQITINNSVREYDAVTEGEKLKTPPQAMEKIQKMSQTLGSMIDRENGYLTNLLKSDKRRGILTSGNSNPERVTDTLNEAPARLS